MTPYKTLFKPTVLFWILAAMLMLESTRRTAFWSGVYQQTLPFYTGLRPGWLTLSQDEVKQTLELGDGGDWNILTTRAMMNRWRLREISPEPWKALMNDYDKGLWISAPREELEVLFAKADADWVERRSLWLKDQPSESPLLFSINQLANGVQLRLNTQTPSEQIGSALVLTIEVPLDAPKVSPAVYWQTNKSRRSALRRMLGSHVAELSRDEVKEKRVDSVYYDFSWQPDWLAPGIELVQLDVEFAEGAEFRVLSVTGIDSPLFPIPTGKPQAND